MRKLYIVAIAVLLMGLLVVGCGVTDDSKETGNSKQIEENNGKNDQTNGQIDENEEDPDTPISSEADGVFIIENPEENQEIESGKELVIKGKTRLRKFSIEIEDGHNILGKTSVELDNSSEGVEDFIVSLKIDEHTSPSGMILFNSEESTEPELILPIKFK